jgi:DnaK suppressor protein
MWLACANYAALDMHQTVSFLKAHDESLITRRLAMDKHLSTPFKNQLLTQRSQLLEHISLLRGGAVGRAQASAEHFAPNQDSSAQRASERDLELALDAREAAELDQIDQALQRLENGSYGHCADCRAEIPGARLHAAPAALHCMACQEKSEHAAH